MDYPLKNRQTRYRVLDPKTGLWTRKFRWEKLLEWKAPDGTRYRSPDAAILDRRRWRILEFTPEQIEAEKAEEEE